MSIDPLESGLPDEDIWNIDFSELEFTKELARGSFGKVFKGTYLGVDVAIKQILRHDDPAYMKYIEREISVLKGIRHPYIVGFCGVCLDQSGLYIITEYVDGGDVRNLLKQGNVTWAKRVQIAFDLAKAMYYLHSKKIIHRDLKSKNLLMGTDNRVRLCDFGFARISDFRTQRAMTICGTPGFVAPEIMMGNDYDASCDVFSYGNVLAELITLLRPGKDFWIRTADDGYFLNLEELRKYTTKDCPSKFYALTLACCDYNPVERPDFSQILKIMKEIEAEITPEVPKSLVKSPPTPRRAASNNSNGVVANSPPNYPAPSPSNGLLSSHRKSVRVSSNDANNTGHTNNTNGAQEFSPESYLQTISNQKLNLSDSELIISEKQVAKMVARATNPDFIDSDYVQDLLLFYPVFTSPQYLLNTLIQKHTSVALESFNFSNKDPDTILKKQQLFQIRIIVFLKEWIEKYSDDFSETGMQELAQAFDAIALSSNEKETFSIDKAINKAKQRRVSLAFRYGFQRNIQTPNLPNSSAKKYLDPNLLVNTTAVDFARQITYVDFSLYKGIHPREFLKEAWKRRPDSYLKALLDRAKENSRWIATVILNTKSEERDLRIQLIHKFIEVAQICFTMKNFSGLFAVMNGLQHSSIERLADTWKGVKNQSVATFKSLEQIISKVDHYKVYKLKQENTPAPCIPAMEVFLDELSYQDSSFPDIGKGGIINFTKHRKMARMIRYLCNFKDTGYDVQPSDTIIEYLTNGSLFDDETLQKRSLFCEKTSSFDV